MSARPSVSRRFDLDDAGSRPSTARLVFARPWRLVVATLAASLVLVFALAGIAAVAGTGVTLAAWVASAEVVATLRGGASAPDVEATVVAARSLPGVRAVETVTQDAVRAAVGTAATAAPALRVVPTILRISPAPAVDVSTWPDATVAALKAMPGMGDVRFDREWAHTLAARAALWQRLRDPAVAAVVLAAAMVLAALAGLSVPRLPSIGMRAGACIGLLVGLGSLGLAAACATALALSSGASGTSPWLAAVAAEARVPLWILGTAALTLAVGAGALAGSLIAKGDPRDLPELERTIS